MKDAPCCIPYLDPPPPPRRSRTRPPLHPEAARHFASGFDSCELPSAPPAAAAALRPCTSTEYQHGSSIISTATDHNDVGTQLPQPNPSLQLSVIPPFAVTQL